MKVAVVNLKRLLIALAVPLAVGGLSAFASGSFSEQYAVVNKPPLSPPGWIFPVVWTLLYLAMGYASYLVMTVGGRDAKDALTVYYVQLALNFLWPILFFRFRLYTFAIFELILLIAAVTVMVIRFSHVDERAGYLTLPYLIWLCFALYLNIGVAVLN
ncbi:MAG: TspO/MBR family protein [Acutalibacteraceae bacterium]|nr:tryptophan-rich sensory protein [Clostridia bacterium]MBQ2421282.1 tryptophan-rich sensory protein [Clostridia bacterium]MBQ5597351.1 tryptophan-rich sensory protein [Clostridia bacterium]MEE1127717.1 TspO/MBR family protein [Acutalibacteraceae bacterium]